MEDKAKGLIEELGLTGLSEKEQDDLIITWAETLQDRITVEVMESILPEEREELNKLAEKATDEELNKYMAEHVPDLDMIIRDEYDKFRAEMIDWAKKMREDIAKLDKK